VRFEVLVDLLLAFALDFVLFKVITGNRSIAGLELYDDFTVFDHVVPVASNVGVFVTWNA